MMRITGLTALAVIICMLYTVQHVAAQNQTDSLLHVVAAYKKDDTAKARLYIAIAKTYYLKDAAAEREYAQRGLALSAKLGYTIGIIACNDEIANSLFVQGSYDSALYYHTQALTYSYKANHISERSAIHNNIANIAVRKGFYTDAMQHYDSSLYYALQTGNKTMEARAQSNAANVYYKMGNYPKALSYYLKGLAIHEAKGNELDAASELSNIANVYFRLKDYAKAKQYNERGLQIHRKLNAKNRIIGNYTTAAMIFDAQQQYDAALTVLSEAAEIAQTVGNPFLLSVIHGNMAEMYLKKNDLPRSLALYQQAKAASENMQDAEGVAIAQAGIGEVLCKQDNTAQGLPMMAAALNSLKEQGIKEQAKAVAEKIAGYYQNIGDYKNALQYYKVYDAYRDSLAIGQAKEEAAQMLFNYEIEEKETEIALSVAKTNNKNILLIASLIGILLTAIIAYMFFRNAQRERKRQSDTLKQKEEIEKQAAKLKELNDIKDVTFSVLSHDLRSPVNALTGTMMMLDEKLMTPEEFSMHKNELNNKLQSVSLLLENMLYWAQSRMKGEQALEIEKLSIKRKALKTMAVLKDAAMQKNINLTHNIPEGLHAYGDANQIDIILRNLVSNAIKFTPDGGSVSINGFSSGSNTQISVTDTGVGMNNEQLSKLFNGLNIESTKGTGGEKGTGLGLQLCYEFVQQNGGDLIVTSTVGKGSTFTISLPNTI
ncbi:hypothetical protein CAP35_12935 [Chitinophagaceae bacterium IBVUCB1]|nr:hypothetical protein CAP35_12935 [Chitinophagaceae bacterium IBVUCB1]